MAAANGLAGWALTAFNAQGHVTRLALKRYDESTGNELCNSERLLIQIHKDLTWDVAIGETSVQLPSRSDSLAVPVEIRQAADVK